MAVNVNAWLVLILPSILTITLSSDVCLALQPALPSSNDTLTEDCEYSFWSLETSDPYFYLTNDSVIVYGFFFNVSFYDNFSRPVICAYIVYSGAGGAAILQANDSVVITILVVTVLSIVHSAALLVTYTLFSELRTLPGQVIMNLAASFLAGDIGVIILWSLQLNNIVSTWILIILSHFFLVRFMWMCLAGFEMCRHIFGAVQFKRDSKEKKVKLLVGYLVIGWVGPILFTIVMAGTHFMSKSAEMQILFGIGGYFTTIVPLAIALIFNVSLLIILSLIIRKVVKKSNQYRSHLHSGSPNFTRVFLTILMVLGLGWFSLFIAVPHAESDSAQIIFILFSASQPIFVSLAFLCTKKVLNRYRVFFRCYKENNEASATTERKTPQYIPQILLQLFPEAKFREMKKRCLYFFQKSTTEVNPSFSSVNTTQPSQNGSAETEIIEV